MTQRLKYEYRTQVLFQPGIGRHSILLRCLPACVCFQHPVQEEFSLDGCFWRREGQDGLGNRIITGGTLDWHSGLQFCSSGILDMETYCIPDAKPHSMYRLPSPLVSLTAGAIFAAEGEAFLDRCISIMHKVHAHMEYAPESTTVQTTADDAFLQRRGVCQDYAHLMISACRKAGMHARYVCGLMVGEGATHAWVEVHDGRCWYAFDPTNDSAVAFGYIKLAHGRDASDCPVSRGTFLGVSTQSTQISVKVSEI